MLCGSECWVVMKQHIHNLSVDVVRKLRWMSIYIERYDLK